MTNFVLEHNVTTLKDSKRLAEAGIDLEADGYWAYCLTGYCPRTGKAQWVKDGELYPPKFFNNLLDCMEFQKPGEPRCERSKAYRLDRLLAELPNVYFNDDRYPFFKDFKTDVDTLDEIQMLLFRIFEERGQEAIKACVDLLVLLKGESNGN